MTELTAPPPSYDQLDLVPPDASLPATAPPLADIQNQAFTGPAPLTNTPAQRRKSSGLSAASKNKMDSYIERYVGYSITRQLRKYIEPNTRIEDPELDVEAQFGRQAVRSAQMAIAKKRRLQCISGWLWCFGVILVLLYIALPSVMITIGAIGFAFKSCPFHSNTILVYLVGGGVILAVMVAMRTLPSVLTCLHNRNYCKSRTSSSCKVCICASELIFYAVLAVNLIALVLGTYTTFVEPRPPSCSVAPGPECCDTLVYVSSATVTVVQYILLATTGLFVCLVLACVRRMDKTMRA